MRSTLVPLGQGPHPWPDKYLSNLRRVQKVNGKKHGVPQIGRCPGTLGLQPKPSLSPTSYFWGPKNTIPSSLSMFTISSNSVTPVINGRPAIILSFSLSSYEMTPPFFMRPSGLKTFLNSVFSLRDKQLGSWGYISTEQQLLLNFSKYFQHYLYWNMCWKYENIFFRLLYGLRSHSNIHSYYS